jgi:hypothetical protein
MSTWKKSEWFEKIVSEIREAVADAFAKIEEGACRLQLNYWLESSGFHKNPQELPDREVVTELGKLMTKMRLEGGDVGVFDGAYRYLPSLKRIEKALLSSVLYENVRIPPTPPVMQDARIDAREFYNALVEQVFLVEVDE